MRRLVGGVLFLVLLGGCGDDGEASEASGTTTTTAAPLQLVVRVVAVNPGLGCTSTTPITGTGAPLTARDASGTVIAKGTFALSQAGKICDWSATLALPNPPSFVTLVGDKGDLATVSAADIADGTVTITADGTTRRVS